MYFRTSRSHITHKLFEFHVRTASAQTSGAIIESTWRHERTQLERRAKVTTKVFHCPQSSIHMYGDDIHQASIDAVRLQPESILCERTSANNESSSKRNVAVVQLQGRGWDDLIPTAPEGANLWHFHAALFRVWLSVQSIDAVVAHCNTNGNIDRYTSVQKARDIVLILPHAVLAAMRFPTDLGAIHVTPDSLFMLGSRHNVVQSSLEGLHGIANALGNGLVVTRPGCPVPVIFKILRDAQLSTNFEAWVVPPQDGFLWDIAHDTTLSGNISKCQNSLLQQYANDMLNFSKFERDITHPPRNDAAATPEIAKHICIMSRQSRQRPGAESSRGNLRNLMPETLLNILTQLSAPILLTPSLGIQEIKSPPCDSDSHEIFTASRVSPSTLSGQLDYVHRECAVLLGVHGAGLTNALGLRRGTAIIELMPSGKSFQYFRNVAALLDNTTYDVMSIGKNGRESNLQMSSDEVRQLVDLVSDRLRDSIHRQYESITTSR